MAQFKSKSAKSRFHPKHLIHKDTAGGVRFYWQPSPSLKKKGWKPVALGQDYAKAVAQAKTLNEHVDDWRTGGAKPRAVTKFVARATVSAIIEAYKADEAYLGLAANTQRTYGTALKLVETWAGDQPASFVTTDRVRVFRNSLMQPRAVRASDAAAACRGHPPSKRNADVCGHCGEPIKISHDRAHNTLRVARTLFAFALEAKMIESNPFLDFNLSAPPPRDQMWDYADVAAFCAAAKRTDYPGLAFVVELAEYIGQREEDILTMQASQWREVHNLDPEHQRQLAGDDGKVMGLFIRQKKGSHGVSKRWVGIPIAGEMRKRIEAAIATNARRAVPVTTIAVDDVTGRPWTIRQFIRKFTEAKDEAVEPSASARADGVLPHPALADLQFRDLRRTCVVRLGELGLEDQLISAITGHKLESVKKILEVYMPRTTKMAARAVIARIGQGARPAPEKQEDVA